MDLGANTPLEAITSMANPALLTDALGGGLPF